MYKAAREAGVDVKGYIPNYLPRIVKPEIAEILFNDVQTVSSKMVGASKLLDSFTNTKDWIKKNPEKAAELENIIAKSILSREMRRVLNIAIGNCVSVPANRVELTMDVIRTTGVECWEIGEVYDGQ